MQSNRDSMKLPKAACCIKHVLFVSHRWTERSRLFCFCFVLLPKLLSCYWTFSFEMFFIVGMNKAEITSWQILKFHTNIPTRIYFFLGELRSQTSRSSYLMGGNKTASVIYSWCTLQLLGQMCISRAEAGRSCGTKMVEQKVWGSHKCMETLPSGVCDMWGKRKQTSWKASDPQKNVLQMKNLPLSHIRYFEKSQTNIKHKYE